MRARVPCGCVDVPVVSEHFVSLDTFSHPSLGSPPMANGRKLSRPRTQVSCHHVRAQPWTFVTEEARLCLGAFS